MSFIYNDQNLIEELIKSSLEFSSKFTKEGQLIQKDMANLNVLLNNLLHSSNESTDPTNVSFKSNNNEVEDAVVDVVPQVLDGGAARGGTIQLQLKDLKSPQTLNDWLQQNDIKININGKLIDFNDNNFDHRVVMNTLFARANILTRHAGTADKAKFEAYVNQIKALAGQLTGLDGKPIHLSGGMAPTQTSINSNIDKGQLINQIASYKPLSTRVIDFEKIRQFFGMVKEFISASNSPRRQNFETIMNNTETQMNALTALTTNNDVSVVLSYNYEDVLHRLKVPSDGLYRVYSSFIRGLETVVQNVENILFQIQTAYYDRMSSAAKEAIGDQIVGGSCAAAQNLTTLQVYLNNSPHIGKK